MIYITDLQFIKLDSILELVVAVVVECSISISIISSKVKVSIISYNISILILDFCFAGSQQQLQTLSNNNSQKNISNKSTPRLVNVYLEAIIFYH